MRLSTLRKKRKARVKARKRQWRLWRRTGKQGHLKAFRVHQRAARKLTRLIRKASTPSNVSKAGVHFIASFEGYSRTPTDALDGYSTVGIGHLIAHRRVTAADRRAVWVKGQKVKGELTRAEAEQLLAHDLATTYEPPVLALFKKGAPLEGKWSDPVMSALTSFTFNCGIQSLHGAPGFETIGRAVQSGSFRAIGDAMLLYDRGPNGRLPGLTRRRKAERRLLLTGNYSTD